MSSNFKELSGFSWNWIDIHVRDRESWSRKRISLEYQCTYLTRRTLGAISSILDAGCGGAFLNRYIEGSKQAVSYVGIDRSIASLTAARTRFPGKPFLLSDVRPLPFQTNTFNLAYSVDVVIHHPAPYEVVTELYRVAQYVLLRIRTADITDVFTARYRDYENPPQVNEAVHQFFPLNQVLEFLKALEPTPASIRYRIHKRYPRTYDAHLYKNKAAFSSYFVTDFLIAKGPPKKLPIPVTDDTDYSLVQTALRRLLLRNHRSYISTTA